MATSSLPITGIARRESWGALLYVGVYLGYLTQTLESELAHWATLVVLPFLLVWLLRPPATRRVTAVLASFGVQRGNLWRGIGWGALGVLAIGVFQGLGGSTHAAEIREMVRTGRVLWAFPLAFLAMLLTAGFTEEFFFRGFLQTRLTALTGSRLAGLAGSALAFGVYHLPYAYLHPNWPSHGDWGAALAAAMGQGGIAGLLLGALYLWSRGNLLACVVLHAGVNAAWAMTMIKFGG